MTPWNGVLGGLGEAIRDLGAWNATLYAVDCTLRKASDGEARLVKYLLVAQPVPAEPVRLRSSVASPISKVGPEHPIVKSFPRPTVVVANRFATGSVCYVAQIREKFAGFLWLAFDGYDEDGVRCRYECVEPERSVWDYDVNVEPEYCLGRTFSRLWAAANRRLADECVTWSFSRISAFNSGSLAAHNRLGARTLFSAAFLCVGPLQLTLAGTWPFISFSWSGFARPTFRLRVPGS